MFGPNNPFTHREGWISFSSGYGLEHILPDRGTNVEDIFDDSVRAVMDAHRSSLACNTLPRLELQVSKLAEFNG